MNRLALLFRQFQRSRKQRLLFQAEQLLCRKFRLSCPGALKKSQMQHDDILPDGIAFGAKGDIYVAMATAAQSGVTILRPDGTERARLRNKLLSPFAPYDGPANIAFDGAGRILLTNHAPVTGLALRKFSILDVDVGDPGAPLFTP